jgi:hypothetical protein
MPSPAQAGLPHFPPARTEVGPIVPDSRSVACAEVYLGWTNAPVEVAAPRSHSRAPGWEDARLILQERVLSALTPVLRSGWRVDGNFAAAVRWNMSTGHGADWYEGCWVRLRQAVD